MAREKISLIDNEERQHKVIEAMIENGDINKDNFHTLSPEQQKLVQNKLFEMSSKKIEPNKGLSSLEFITFAFMRLMNKKVDGLALSAEDREIEASMNRIMEMHDITNDNKYKKDWLFDYLGYAELHASQFLENRKEHIERKKGIMGESE